MTATIAKDDLDEVTEIVELNAEKVSAVGSPANGTPWLLMKSAAGGLESDDGTPFLLLKSRRDDHVPDVIRVGDNEGGPGLRPDEPGPRAEKIDAVLESADAIDESMSDADSIEAMLDLRPDPEPAHDSIVPKIVGAASATLKLEKALAAATDPVERERLAEQITLAKLKALHNGAAVKSNLGGNVMSKVVTDNDLQRFRKEMAQMPPGPEREEFGQKVTHLALLKASYEEQIAATNAAIELAQSSATASATLDQPAGALQRVQVALRGGQEDLGAVDSAGNRGDHLANRGKLEPEPQAHSGFPADGADGRGRAVGSAEPESLGTISAVGNRGDVLQEQRGVAPVAVAELGAAERELAEAREPAQKALAAETVTRLRLAMSHAPRRVVSRGTVRKAAQRGDDKARKAVHAQVKRAASRVLR